MTPESARSQGVGDNAVTVLAVPPHSSLPPIHAPPTLSRMPAQKTSERSPLSATRQVDYRVRLDRVSRPNSFARFRETSLSAVTPGGWLRSWFETQARGLTGHLEVAGYPFNARVWDRPGKFPAQSGAKWWPYEQTAYWIDGAVRCGCLLRNRRLIRKARAPLDFVLAHQHRDGYLGPRFLKKEPREGSHKLRWSHAVLFRAFMAAHSASGDARIVKALHRHYLSRSSSHSDHRDVCNVETMLWVYERTGDRKILRAAEKAYAGFNKRFARTAPTMAELLSNRRSHEHGVTFHEIAKLGAILYTHTGNRRYLRAAQNGYRKIERDSLLVDGVASSRENLKGKGALETHETCDVADQTWSLGYLLMATGEARYADMIERACFNAGPGSVRKDFAALQYFSGLNQLVADKSSNHNPFDCGGASMSFRPRPFTECCTGNVHRIMPNYAARMWMTDDAGGIVATLYGPSRFELSVGGSGDVVKITEETRYPFEETIRFRIGLSRPVRFSLSLRIPGWSRNATCSVNGEPIRERLKPGSFWKLTRRFQPNDVVTLQLPMRTRAIRQPRGGIAVERGPLVYALRIKETWSRDRSDTNSSDRFPAWNLYSGSPWNYALVLKPGLIDDQVEVIQNPRAAKVWSLDDPPITLRVPARRVRDWKLIKSRSILREHFKEPLRGRFIFTPPLPDPKSLRPRLGKRIEAVDLVPYGATHLRLTVFPRGR
jgi:uncharacterized protein